MKIIDTHQHLWDFSIIRPPWLSGAGLPLEKSHTPGDYADATLGTGIVASVYMEVDVTPEDRLVEANSVYELCADPENPMRAAVVGGRPDSPEFAAYLARIESPYLRGVRGVLHGGAPPRDCLRPEFLAGLRLLGQRNLLFDFCVRPNELADVATVARALPENRFILDHCGNAPIGDALGGAAFDDWKRGLESVASRDNVVCKISGIVASCDPNVSLAAQLTPAIAFALDAFGPDRVLFASDWPVCTKVASLATWISTLKEIVAGRTETDREKLFFGNAARVYDLSV